MAENSAMDSLAVMDDAIWHRYRKIFLEPSKNTNILNTVYPSVRNFSFVLLFL